VFWLGRWICRAQGSENQLFCNVILSGAKDLPRLKIGRFFVAYGAPQNDSVVAMNFCCDDRGFPHS